MNQVRINIKPLSVNDAFRGKRFASKEYLVYQNALCGLLPKLDLPSPPFHIQFTFGMSNLMSDVDNPVKPLLDVLQKKYSFNDRVVNKITAEKIKVDKGSEYIAFEIRQA